MFVMGAALKPEPVQLVTGSTWFHLTPLLGRDRVYVKAATWESFVIQFLSRWGEEVRNNTRWRCPMVAVNKPSKEGQPSKEAEAVLQRWGPSDICGAMGVAFTLKARSDFRTGNVAGVTNGLLCALLGYKESGSATPVVLRDVLEVHGWLERQSTGTNIGGVPRASRYRLTVPTRLFGLIEDDPDTWSFGTDGMDTSCLTVIDALEDKGWLPRAGITGEPFD